MDPEFRCGLGRVRVMRVCDGLIGVRAGAVAWERLRTEPVGLVYLGSDGDHDFCVIDDDGAEMADLDFIDVRAGVADLDNADIQLVWSALALTAWHRRALFCERCGSALESANYGRKRVCENGHEVFARMDPAVIMGIINGAGSCLWPETADGLLGESLCWLVLWRRARRSKRPCGVKCGKKQGYVLVRWSMPVRSRGRSLDR